MNLGRTMPTIRARKVLTSCCAAAFLVLAFQPRATALDCGPLEALQLPDVRFTKVVAKQPATAAEGDATPRTAYCEGQGIIGDEIGFVIVLPDKASWNGKFFMAGVGGFAGSYNARSLVPALNKGYAGVMTDGKEGLLVPPKKEDELADAIARLLNDHDLRMRLAENGRQRAEEFRWERVAARVMDYYESFLEVQQTAVSS